MNKEESIKDPIVKDYMQGMGISYLSEKYDVSRPSIYKWLKEEGAYRSHESRRKYSHEDTDAMQVCDAHDFSDTVWDALSELLSRADIILDGVKDLSERLDRLEKVYSGEAE